MAPHLIDGQEAYQLTLFNVTVSPRWPDRRTQQAHPDIVVDDLDAGEARALELGARRWSSWSKTGHSSGSC
jgi:hypothetical protein